MFPLLLRLLLSLPVVGDVLTALLDPAAAAGARRKAPRSKHDGASVFDFAPEYQSNVY